MVADFIARNIRLQILFLKLFDVLKCKYLSFLLLAIFGKYVSSHSHIMNPSSILASVHQHLEYDIVIKQFLKRVIWLRKTILPKLHTHPHQFFSNYLTLLDIPLSTGNTAWNHRYPFPMPII